MSTTVVAFAAVLGAATALQWYNLPTVNTPSARRAAAVGYDAAGGRLVMFGGKPLNGETWLLDLTTRTWSQAAIAGPDARFSMVYGVDQADRKMYIASGQGASYASTQSFAFAFPFSWLQCRCCPVSHRE